MYTTNMPHVPRVRPATTGERVRTVLRILAEQNGPHLSASTRELATAADTRPEEVSRELARLQRAGIIRRNGPGDLTVLDRPALLEA